MLSSQSCSSSGINQCTVAAQAVIDMTLPQTYGYRILPCSSDLQHPWKQESVPQPNGDRARSANLDNKRLATPSDLLPSGRDASNHPVAAGHCRYSVQIEARICKSLHVVKCRQVPCRNHGSTSDPLLSSPGPTTNATLFLVSGEWHCMKRARAS